MLGLYNFFVLVWAKCINALSSINSISLLNVLVNKYNHIYAKALILIGISLNQGYHYHCMMIL